MIATAKNYDVICFQLRNNLYSQLESPLKKDLNRLSNDIKSVITSGKKIQTPPMAILSQVFNLRIKALKWLATNATFDYMEMLKDIFPQIEELNIITNTEQPATIQYHNLGISLSSYFKYRSLRENLIIIYILLAE